ncbi:MAG: HesA/MoeB/ThiF family protein [Deltaproteobacteria bacterium]|nr:HesA/MoeB/ThiF family protein [Deltaproteobacteria bacterium]
MEEEVIKNIRSKSRVIRDPAGRNVGILEERHALEIGRIHGLMLHEIYILTLKLGICPYRYVRNREILSLEELLRLAESRVAVVGAGGLGGTVLSILGRTGIGHLVVIDFDVFDESNLNRQAFSHCENLGKPKAEEARSQLERINPGVDVSAYQIRLNAENGKNLLKDCQVVVDALDNVESRITLMEAAKALGVPLVHGAIAGFEGQIMSLFPGDEGLSRIYGKAKKGENDFTGPEAVLGVPGITAAVIAAFQAMEVIKILLKRGRPFTNTMVYLDLERGEINQFRFD